MHIYKYSGYKNMLYLKCRNGFIKGKLLHSNIPNHRPAFFIRTKTKSSEMSLIYQFIFISAWPTF